MRLVGFNGREIKKGTCNRGKQKSSCDEKAPIPIRGPVSCDFIKSVFEKFWKLFLDFGFKIWVIWEPNSRLPLAMRFAAIEVHDINFAVVVKDDPFKANNPDSNTLIILTNGPVDKPLVVYDAYDARSEIENALLREARQAWFMERPPINTKAGFIVHVYLTIFVMALTTVFREKTPPSSIKIYCPLNSIPRILTNHDRNKDGTTELSSYVR